MQLTVGSSEDLCRMQRKFIEEKYDDVASSDVLVREVRDAHIAMFREYIAETARAFSEHISELHALSGNARAFAAKVQSLPGPLSTYQKTLYSLRKSWELALAAQQHGSEDEGRMILCDHTDPESMFSFVVELLKSKSSSAGPHAVTALEILQGKGAYWFLPPGSVLPECVTDAICVTIDET